MLGLARGIEMFQPTIASVVRGDPEAVLFVEFGEEEEGENLRRLFALSELIGTLGYAFDKRGPQWGGVVEVLGPKLQAAIAEVRAAGLNVMMSMKEAASRSLLWRIARCRWSTSRTTPTGSPRSSPSMARAHLVRARLGRLPACAAGAQSAPGEGCQGDARDRRGGVRAGARV